MIAVHSILAATDLSTAGEHVIQAAMTLAQAFEAECHVVHVAPTSSRRDASQLQTALADQVDRCVSPDAAGRVSVDVVFDRPYHGILVHATTVGADLVVMGGHRRGAAAARWAGTTAERVVRAADVPCLVVRQRIEAPIRHVGAVYDGTPAGRAGAQVAADWMPILGDADASTLSLVHVGEAAEAEDPSAARMHLDIEPPIRVADVVLSGTDVDRTVGTWTETADADLLVVPSEGRRGWRRVWQGSVATMLTMRSDCPVLLLPPAFWRRTPLPLSRVAVAIEADEDNEAARAWAEQWVGNTGASLRRLPAVPATDRLAWAHDVNADLLVVREDRTAPHAPLPADLVDLLEHTPIPVLVLRDLPARPIRHILVAVDTGDLWYEKLGWARRLAASTDARVTIYHAVDLSLSSRVRREPGGELVPAASAWLHDGVESKVIPAMRAWLWERVRLAGLPLDRVDVEVGLQDPWFAISAVAQRKGADLVIVAAHTDATPGRAPLSPVARATLERGTYSALVVVDRAKREAAWGQPVSPAAWADPMDATADRPGAGQ